MPTRRRVKKKNIKEDQLVTYAVNLSRWAQEHFNQVIIGVVVLVAVIAVAVFTANSRQGSARQAEQSMAVAMSQFQSGDFETARASLEQAANRYGGATAARARFFMGESSLRMARYEDALASYDAYLAQYSDYPAFRESAMVGRAMCYEGLENYQAAAEELVSLLAIMDPDDPRYLENAYRAGEFFARAGDTEQAAKYFQEVSDKASGNLKDKASVAAALLSN
jgi:tetratricopeptide (TPR) repeat protein